MTIPEAREKMAALSKADQCLVHRIAYYRFCNELISDHLYDRLEAEAELETPPPHLIYEPGSEGHHYPEHIQEIACAFFPSHKV